MGQAERISVELPDDVAEAMREAVAAGEFASMDEAMQQALSVWYFHRNPLPYSDEELLRLWDEGIASGDPEDGEVAFARIKADLEAFIIERHGPDA